MTSYPPPGYPPPGQPQPGYPQPAFPYDPNDLSKPLYGATIGQAFTRFWKKYVVFTGRASRSEFWWWYLVAAGVSVVLGSINLAVVGVYVPPAATSANFDPRQIFLDSMLHSLRASIASSIWSLAIFVGQLALSTRRLHDTGRSGWWYLLILIPLVGVIILIVFWAEAPKPAGQRYDR
jgi:uncharacterized membrane protein YhaH (DUF805 family)